jgi:2-amino-4-hydroxy-6-hydroxymethyldihydropteridine diphosphokinase
MKMSSNLPRTHHRPFVLVPWTLMDEDAILPGHGRIADLSSSMTAQVSVLK